jgi:large subunit ribosomal protein L18
MAQLDRRDARKRRKKSIRKRVSGDAERPRLTVFRSNKHIYAQVIDDFTSTSLAAASTQNKALKAELEKSESKVEQAQVVGQAIAKACASKGIKQVVLDRNGYLYHGRVRALADAAREAGLEF